MAWMKIGKCGLMALIFSVLVLSGCGDGGRGREAQNEPPVLEEKAASTEGMASAPGTEGPADPGDTEEGDASAEDVASDPGTEDPMDMEEGDTFAPVDEAERKELSAFVQRMDAYGFLLSEYASSAEVSLGQVFYMGAGLAEEPTPGEVQDYLRAVGQEELMTTCIKLDAGRVDDLLRRRLDLDPGELDLSAVGVYLPEHRAYFREEADVNYIKYECVSAIRNAVDGYDAMFHTDDPCMEGFSDLRTVLLRHGDDFQFIMNECASPAEPHEDDSSAMAERLWDGLYQKKFSMYEPREIRRGIGDEVFSVVLDAGEQSFEEGGKKMRFESIVSFMGEEEDGRYQFWWHEDYYDGEELFGTKTRDWFWVDGATGEVSVS